MAPDPTTTAEQLTAALAPLEGQDAPAMLRRLAGDGLDRLPAPGGGRTLERWQALAAVAQHDLSLAKLYEGHTDALAILHELGAGAHRPEHATWGVWAAEAPDGRVIAEPAADGRVRLHGRKRWCSGAACASHALLTAWHADGRGPLLVRLVLGQPGVEVGRDAWRAVGMHDSASLDVQLNGVTADAVGGEGDYLSRPGFWHGGAGVAACWHGGAVAIARALHDAAQAPGDGAGHPLRLASLGRVDLVLRANRALLREAAAWIDRHPRDDASATALRVRLSSDAAATRVIEEVGRALGAGPFCRDRGFARLCADLPVFVRQSHADRDLAALGGRLRASGVPAWGP